MEFLIKDFINSMMLEYNNLLDTASSNLKGALLAAERGETINLSPDEVHQYTKLRHLQQLITTPLNSLDELSEYDLTVFYNKLLSRASNELKYILTLADSGVAFSISPNEIELYNEIRYVQSLIRKKIETEKTINR